MAFDMGAQHPGLRASCDGCYASKVKCVPTPSGCQRCLSLNSRCVHSPPGRPGRVPATRNTTNHLVSSNMPSPSEGAEVGERADLTISTMDLTSDALLLDTATLDESLDRWPSTVNPSIDEAILDQSLVAFPEFAIRAPILPATDRQWNELGERKHACVCFKSILQALKKVQQTDLRTMGLDVALRRNKDALLSICNSIKCSTSHDSTSRLLVLILLRKTLKHYQALFHLRLSTKAIETPSEGIPITNSYSPPPVYSVSSRTSPAPSNQSDYFNLLPYPQADQRPGSAYQTARLTLGTYELDEADERSLKKQVFLLDLAKVPKLLERLDQRACGLDEADGLDLYNMMRGSLIADFRSVMADVQS